MPDIADSYEMSQDGRTYTFHLRPNVRFHSGKAVTADDVLYSLERSCSPSTGSPVAATYLGDIVGAKEMLAGQADHLAGVKVVDNATIQIQIDAPRASFLAKLSHPVAFVVDQASIGLPPTRSRLPTAPVRSSWPSSRRTTISPCRPTPTTTATPSRRWIRSCSTWLPVMPSPCTRPMSWT